MKKLVTAILLLGLLAQAAGALAFPYLPAEGVIRVNAYLREQPTTDSRAIRTITQGTTVLVLDVVNSWMYVQIGIHKGYIRGDLFYDTTHPQPTATSNAKSQSKQGMSSWLPSVLLRYGMRGDEVRQLQEALVALGYNALTIDGIFNENTEAMVKAFQKNYGLTADGIVGEETMSVLQDALGYYNQMNQ